MGTNAAPARSFADAHLSAGHNLSDAVRRRCPYAVVSALLEVTVTFLSWVPNAAQTAPP